MPVPAAPPKPAPTTAPERPPTDCPTAAPAAPPTAPPSTAPFWLRPWLVTAAPAAPPKAPPITAPFLPPTLWPNTAPAAAPTPPPKSGVRSSAWATGAASKLPATNAAASQSEREVCVVQSFNISARGEARTAKRGGLCTYNGGFAAGMTRITSLYTCRYLLTTGPKRLTRAIRWTTAPESRW